MCGIIGYVGERDQTLEVLVNGLSGLEYRGYDSAGIALAAPDLDVIKKEGELSELEAALSGVHVANPAGIGHTRWSTHGPPSDRNAHPHTDCSDEVAVVHNGIISNYRALRDRLGEAGHEFVSDTDTEVIPHLIEAHLEAGSSPETAFRRTVDEIEGSYAIAAAVAGSDIVFATRQDSPLVVGVGDGESFLASDVPAFIDYTDRVIYLEDGEFARLSPSGVTITDAAGSVVDATVDTIEWSPEDAGKSGYDHYMHKEINEQPNALRQCLRGRVEELSGSIELEELADLEVSGPVQFVACGTSYHAALYGERILRERGIPAQSFIASEYDTETVPVDSETLVIGVTQSGETADTLSALRAANRANATTLAVTNVVASSAARECDYTTYIRAGPEIGVAATKTFASQQVALAMVAATIAESRSHELIKGLRNLPNQVQTVLDTSVAREVADVYVDADAYFFIGRGYQYPVALEGALKMKEITYKHAEGFAAGELKHGPLALVTDRTPVFALVTGSGENVMKTLGNVNEVDARGAPVVAITDAPDAVEGYADWVLEVPDTHELFVPVLANVQLQLLSYWVANELGRSIDKPRNLAKSVTVE